MNVIILYQDNFSLLSENPKRIQNKNELEGFLANMGNSGILKEHAIDNIESDKSKEFYTKFVLNIYDDGSNFLYSEN